MEVAAVIITLVLAKLWRLPTAETIDLGQLIVALILIPPAIVAFWQATNALRESTSRPALRLAFLAEDGYVRDTYTMTIPKDGGSTNRVTLAIENTGEAVAVWWQAEFDFPVDMMRLLRSGQNRVHIMARHVPFVTMDTVGDVERRVAQSTGTVGLFPGPPVQLLAFVADIEPGSLPQLRRQFQIKYRVITDRSEPLRGELPLTLETQSAA